MNLFFYGTLCHAPLLRAVAGAGLALRPARLAGFDVAWAAGRGYPTIRAVADAVAEGLLAEDVAPEVAERLDFYEAGFGYSPREVTVTTAQGAVAALVYLPVEPLPPGAPWSLDSWARQWGAIAVEAAGEVMRLRGCRPPAEVFARYPQILVRAASALRAARGGPVTRRHAARPDDIATEAWRQPYARYFALEETDLRFRRFDGTMSAPVTRAVFVSGDAATVLPYDPARDRVLLVEQFRAGPFGRGDGQPWQLEAIAGRVDPGETPEAAARREAVEEAGLTLGKLLPVAAYYPSPGAKSEYIYSFLGLADLPDALAGGLAGIAEEHEDIRSHLVGFDELMRLVATGEVENAPLILSAQFLATRRDGLRAAS